MVSHDRLSEQLISYRRLGTGGEDQLLEGGEDVKSMESQNWLGQNGLASERKMEVRMST